VRARVEVCGAVRVAVRVAVCVAVRVNTPCKIDLQGAAGVQKKSKESRN